MKIFDATEEKGLGRCTKKLGWGRGRLRGEVSKVRQRRVMLKAIVGDIEGWRYGGQAAKIVVGVCAPGYARGGQKSVSRKPRVGCNVRK